VNIDKRLTPSDKSVYIALSSFQGNKKDCYPSLKAIAERSGVHISHISECTKRLQEYGYIKIIHRGKRISNVYIICDDYAKSAESPQGDYAGSDESDYARSAESDYAVSDESNIKTTNKKTTTTTPEDDVFFKNKYFIVTNQTHQDWKSMYGENMNFRNELTITSDILTQKENNGETIRSPMAFFHKHLENVRQAQSKKEFLKHVRESD